MSATISSNLVPERPFGALRHAEALHRSTAQVGASGFVSGASPPSAPSNAITLRTLLQQPSALQCSRPAAPPPPPLPPPAPPSLNRQTGSAASVSGAGASKHQQAKVARTSGAAAGGASGRRRQSPRNSFSRSRSGSDTPLQSLNEETLAAIAPQVDSIAEQQQQQRSANSSSPSSTSVLSAAILSQPPPLAPIEQQQQTSASATLLAYNWPPNTDLVALPASQSASLSASHTFSHTHSHSHPHMQQMNQLAAQQQQHQPMSIPTNAAFLSGAAPPPPLSSSPGSLGLSARAAAAAELNPEQQLNVPSSNVLVIPSSEHFGFASPAVPPTSWLPSSGTSQVQQQQQRRQAQPQPPPPTQPPPMLSVATLTSLQSAASDASVQNNLRRRSEGFSRGTLLSSGNVNLNVNAALMHQTAAAQAALSAAHQPSASPSQSQSILQQLSSSPSERLSPLFTYTSSASDRPVPLLDGSSQTPGAGTMFQMDVKPNLEHMLQLTPAHAHSGGGVAGDPLSVMPRRADWLAGAGAEWHLQAESAVATQLPLELLAGQPQQGTQQLVSVVGGPLTAPQLASRLTSPQAITLIGQKQLAQPQPQPQPIQLQLQPLPAQSSQLQSLTATPPPPPPPATSAIRTVNSDTALQLMTNDIRTNRTALAAAYLTTPSTAYAPSRSQPAATAASISQNISAASTPARLAATTPSRSQVAAPSQTLISAALSASALESSTPDESSSSSLQIGSGVFLRPIAPAPPLRVGSAVAQLQQADESQERTKQWHPSSPPVSQQSFGPTPSELELQLMRPPPAVTPSEASFSMGGGGSRGRVSAAPSAETRRVSHISAEQKRRKHIRNNFEVLHSLLARPEDRPGSADAGQTGASSPDSASSASACNFLQNRLSKASILHEGARHIQRLKGERQQLSNERARLENERVALYEEIKRQQVQLPAGGSRGVSSGSDVPAMRPGSAELSMRFTRMACERTDMHWKFYLFALFCRPLFERYNQMVTGAMATRERPASSALAATTRDWVAECCTMLNLRNALVDALRAITTSTSVLTHPAQLPRELVASAHNELRRVEGTGPGPGAGSNTGTGASVSFAQRPELNSFRS